jgi:hypothetical protein
MFRRSGSSAIGTILGGRVELSADAMLVEKPFSATTLMAAVEELLDRTRSQPQ